MDQLEDARRGNVRATATTCWMARVVDHHQRRPRAGGAPGGRGPQRPGALPAEGHDDGASPDPSRPGGGLASPRPECETWPRTAIGTHHSRRRSKASTTSAPGRSGRSGASLAAPLRARAARRMRAPGTAGAVRRSTNARRACARTFVGRGTPCLLQSHRARGGRQAGDRGAQMSRKVSMVAPSALSRSARSS